MRKFRRPFKVSKFKVQFVEHKILIMLFLLGVIAFYLILFGSLQVHVERIPWSPELINDKPKHKYRMMRDAKVYDKDGKKVIGELKKGVLIYSDLESTNDRIAFTGVVYGWIWAESVLAQDDVLTLANDENIRDSGQGTLLGHYLAGTILNKKYGTKHKRNNWYLFSNRITVSCEDAAPLKESRDNRRWIWELPTIVTITTEYGAYRIRGWTPFGYLMFLGPLFLVFVLYIVFLVADRKVISKGQPIAIRTLPLEFIKTVLQVLAGVIVAAIVYLLGFK